MTDTVPTPVTSIRVADATTPVVWRRGIAAGLVAAAATTATAAIARESGIAVAIAGEAIPLAAFGQLTMIGTLIGIALAAVLVRRSTRPRTVFVRTTVTLSVLSLVPDLVADADTSTRVLLAATHAIAAVIVIPVLARQLQH